MRGILESVECEWNVKCFVDEDITDGSILVQIRDDATDRAFNHTIDSYSFRNALEPRDYFCEAVKYMLKEVEYNREVAGRNSQTGEPLIRGRIVSYSSLDEFSTYYDYLRYMKDEPITYKFNSKVKVPVKTKENERKQLPKYGRY